MEQITRIDRFEPFPWCNGSI